MIYEFKGTPAPWRWEISLRSKDISLCGGNRPPYDLTVMSFERWGMQGAQPLFFVRTKDGIPTCKPAHEYKVVWPGREHHASWFQTIDNPDANLIASAPDLLTALISLVTDIQKDHLDTVIDLDQATLAIEKALNIKK